MKSIVATVVGLAMIGGATFSPTAAQETEFLWADWKCGQNVKLTRKLIHSVTSAANSFSGFRGGGGLPPFLVGNLSQELGAILFIKHSGGWRAVALEEGATSYGVYVAPEKRSAVIFTMMSREGPGQEYTLYRSTDGLRSGACSTLPPPRAIPHYLYMDIKDFNIDARRQGTVVGTVEFSEPKTKTVWYRSRTTDGGAHWSRPLPISTKPGALAGVFTRAADAGLDDLVNSLKATGDKLR
jgi:hypothetical protein